MFSSSGSIFLEKACRIPKINLDRSLMKGPMVMRVAEALSLPSSLSICLFTQKAWGSLKREDSKS